MTAVKAYILRLIFCGFLVSLCGAILRGKRAGKALTLCGGCLLILTAVRPLLRVDLSQLPDLVTGMTHSERQALAREKNDAILRSLVEQQSAAWIEERGKELGMEITAEVTASITESGVFVPDRVSIHGSWTAEGQSALSELLERELDVPPVRQSWSGG